MATNQAGNERAHVVCVCPDCAAPTKSDDTKRWAAWVSIVVGCYLDLDLDSPKLPGIANVIENRLWGLPKGAVAAAQGEPSDEDLRAMWRAAGGIFHGPIVETGTMAEMQLLPFLKSLIKPKE